MKPSLLRAENRLPGLYVKEVRGGLRAACGVAVVGDEGVNGCGSKNRYQNWNPGKWKHGPKPAVYPSW